jgi:tRNA pseudouridine32 synthase/23S rRNA pseudouridine746 synthase
MNGELQVIYTDDDIVVVNKPGGLLSVPGRTPAGKDCVATRLRGMYPGMIPQPAVHRLDMYTGGLMVYARTERAHKVLSMQFERRMVRKKYVAIVEGEVAKSSGEIDLRFRLDPGNRPLQVHDPVHGRQAKTLWKKVGGDLATSRIEFRPLTGRTHQLRVHSAHPLGLNAPIVGDSLYGSGRDGDDMLLCATSLGFYHPGSGRWTNFAISPQF